MKEIPLGKEAEKLGRLLESAEKATPSLWRAMAVSIATAEVATHSVALPLSKSTKRFTGAKSSLVEEEA